MKMALLVAAGFCAFSSLAYAKGAGTSAAQFLAILPGARASGMGGVGAADTHDANALCWNPAGLALLKKPELNFSHMEYVQGLKYDFIAYAEPTAAYGTFSAGAVTLYSGKISRTTEDAVGNYQSDGGSFSSMEYAILVGWGKQLGKKVSLGLSAKSIRQSIDAVSASGYAGDAGVGYAVNDTFHMGLSAQNMGTQIKGNDLPANVKWGCAAVFPRQRFNVSADVDYPLAGKPSVAAGWEKKVARSVAIRNGYTTRPETGGFSGIHAGVGIVWQQLTFDYAFGLYGDIGGSHMLSLGYAFTPGVGSIFAPKVKVFPNPVDFSAGGDGAVLFTNLSRNAKIRLYDKAGKLVKTINPGSNENNGVNGRASWDGKNNDGDDVAAGGYLYLITDKTGATRSGKIRVIRAQDPAAEAQKRHESAPLKKSPPSRKPQSKVLW